LNVIPLEQASEYIDAFVKKVSGNKELFDLFQEMASFYLYSPSSPLLNEQLYIPFAKSALSSNILTSEERIQYSYRLEVSQKNNPGDTAANFTYTTPDEKETTLHKLESPYTLLYFHNYDCENCKETLKQLASNSTIKSLIKNKVLQPLMIYTEGDIELWEEHKHNSPEGWLSGNDKNENIKMKRIYELRAMPSIYLINKEKRVILKDVQPEKLLFYLSSIEASVK
jgi:thioredoxin-related protein